MTNELKPCPFCGGDGQYINHQPFDDVPEIHVVQCEDECCELSSDEGMDAVIAAWNTRASTPASEIDAMKKVVEAVEELTSIEAKVEEMDEADDAYTNEEVASVYSALNVASNNLTAALSEYHKIKEISNGKIESVD